MSYSTAEWLSRWDSGDRGEATRALQQPLGRALAQAAKRYRLDSLEIEGAFNERTYGADMRALRGVGGAESLAHAVRRIVAGCASKLARNEQRARARLRRFALDYRMGPASASPDPAAAAGVRDLADACQRALLQLPAPYAAVLRAQARGLTKREICPLLLRADGTPVSLDRVAQALRFARRLVREVLAGVDIRRRFRHAFALAAAAGGGERQACRALREAPAPPGAGPDGRAVPDRGRAPAAHDVEGGCGGDARAPLGLGARADDGSHELNLSGQPD